MAPVPGNHAALVVDGPACRAAVLDTVAGAERRLHLSSFIFRADEAGHAVADGLVEAAAGGVEVRVLTDAVQSASDLFAEHRDRSARVAVDDLHRRLVDGGVEVRAMSLGHRRPAALGGPVDHRKLVVADGARALVPSFGIGDTYLYPSGGPSGRQRWHDGATVLAGPVVADLDATFRGAWVVAGGIDPGPAAVAAEAGEHRVELIDDPRASGRLHRLFRDRLPALAQRRLWAASPYVTDDTVLSAWAARAEAGVDVAVVRPHPDVTDYLPARVPGVGRLRPWVLRRGDADLLAAGVDLREQRAAFAHLKLTVADDVAVHGSYNLNHRSAHLDAELAVVVEGPDHPERAAALLAADREAAGPAVDDHRPLPRGTRRAVAWVADRLQPRMG